MEPWGRVARVEAMNLTDRVTDVLPSVLTDLKRLIAIPSISSMPEHDDNVLSAADAVAIDS